MSVTDTSFSFLIIGRYSECTIGLETIHFFLNYGWSLMFFHFTQVIFNCTDNKGIVSISFNELF